MSDSHKNLYDITKYYEVEVTQTFNASKELIQQLNKQYNSVKKVLKGGTLDNYEECIVTLHQIEEAKTLSNKIKNGEILKVYDKILKFIEDLEFEDDDRLVYKKFYNNFIEGEIEKIHFLLTKIPIRIKSLLNMTHIYLITNYEAFNRDFFYELLKDRIELIKPYLNKLKKEIELSDIIEFTNIKDLHSYLVEMYIEKLPSNINAFSSIFLEKVFKIDIADSFPNWNSLRENYYRRNIIVHAKGRVNANYLKIIKPCNFKLGDIIENDLDYLESCFNNVHHYFSFIKQEVFNKIN